MENFFVYDNIKFHEICFYYYHKTDEKIKMPKGFYVKNKEEMDKIIILPKILHEILNSDDKGITHYTLYE